MYRVIGGPRVSDVNRHQTIARARNRALGLGDSPWVLFLDDDVVLAPDCVAALVDGLRRRPLEWGALAADYIGQSGGRSRVGHVSMGATLFRREVLSSIRFRWEAGRCECRCCCEDLARRGLRIGYLPTARARHLTGGDTECRPHRRADSGVGVPVGSPHILTAVDWYHFERFKQLFLRTLIATRNSAPVSVVAYGLAPSELRVLAAEKIVADVVERPANGRSPGVRRLHDFQALLARWKSGDVVACWDAGDVMFQARLDSLWRLVAEHPGRLLVVREPVSHPANPALRAWTERMPDLTARRRVFELLAPRPFLNGGFVAGTVEVMQSFLRFGDTFLRRADLVEEPASDQLALNVYCHTHPDRWREVDEGWNYCLAYRRRRVLQPRIPSEPDWDERMRDLPRVVTSGGATVPVVHGNGHTLEHALRVWWTHTPAPVGM